MARPVPIIYECNECIICMEALRQPAPTDVLFEKVSGDPTALVATPCGHIYHRLCLQQWLQTPGDRSCPSCRTVVEQSKMIEIRVSAHENVESGLSSSPASVNSSEALIDRFLKPAHKTMRKLYKRAKTCDKSSSNTNAMGQDFDSTNDNHQEVVQADGNGEDQEGLIDMTTFFESKDRIVQDKVDIAVELYNLRKKVEYHEAWWREYFLRKRQKEERRKKWMEPIQKCIMGIVKVPNYLIRKH